MDFFGKLFVLNNRFSQSPLRISRQKMNLLINPTKNAFWSSYFSEIHINPSEFRGTIHQGRSEKWIKEKLLELCDMFGTYVVLRRLEISLIDRYDRSFFEFIENLLSNLETNSTTLSSMEDWSTLRQEIFPQFGLRTQLDLPNV